MDFVIFNVVIKKFHSPKKTQYIITCISLFASPTLNRKKKEKKEKKERERERNYNMHVTGSCHSLMWTC
jgi:hypothetical protein